MSFELAAKLLHRPVQMCPCSRIGLSVPAAAEIVVEGRFLPNVRRQEGPFGEFLGAYVPVADNHVFEVLAVTRRKDACFHSITCGTPEDLRPLEALTAARVYEHVSRVVRGVLDVSTRPNCMITIVKIRQEYEGHGKHALLAALGSNMDFNKVCIAVDEDVNIYDLNDVMWAYLTRGPANKRALVLEGIPGFYRDDQKDHWGRLALDATMPWGRKAESNAREFQARNQCTWRGSSPAEVGGQGAAPCLVLRETLEHRVAARFVDLAAFHHKLHLLEHFDVLRWVAGDGYQVGVASLLD